MEFGLCTDFAGLEQAKQAGFSYVEWPVSGIEALSEEEYQQKKEALAASGLKCRAFNLLFPGELGLLTTATDADVEAYLDKALARVHGVGAKIAVFGSSKARRRPDDMPYDVAFRRLVEVTRLAGEVAARHDVVIAIEPLDRKETNMINSVAEGACLAAMVNHPNVQVLADYYHVTIDHEPVDDMLRLGGLCHVHIATEGDRLYPTEENEGFMKFFHALKESGYQGCISVEGKTEDVVKDGAAAIACMEKMWEKV